MGATLCPAGSHLCFFVPSFFACCRDARPALHTTCLKPHHTTKNNTHSTSEVEKRALRHPGLSSALGGGVEAFSDVEMSTVGSVGGAPDGGRHGQVPSRVIKARLRFSGKRAGPGGAGWAEVEVTDWQGAPGEEQGMEFDRISGRFYGGTFVYVPVRLKTSSGFGCLSFVRFVSFCPLLKYTAVHA